MIIKINSTLEQFISFIIVSVLDHEANWSSMILAQLFEASSKTHHLIVLDWDMFFFIRYKNELIGINILDSDVHRFDQWYFKIIHFLHSTWLFFYCHWNSESISRMLLDRE